jgi:two-component system KDP operon response regulator KdpE
MLLERVWGKQFTSCSNYLRLYITYLRQKLEDDPGQPLLIVTEWGLGYRLVDRGSHQRLPEHQATAVA